MMNVPLDDLSASQLNAAIDDTNFPRKSTEAAEARKESLTNGGGLQMAAAAAPPPPPQTLPLLSKHAIKLENGSSSGSSDSASLESMSTGPPTPLAWITRRTSTTPGRFLYTPTNAMNAYSLADPIIFCFYHPYQLNCEQIYIGVIIARFVCLVCLFL